jgi:hypothetical protein
MRSVCGQLVAGWHASDSVSVVSPKSNVGGIASGNGHVERGFVKQLKHPTSQLRRLNSRRVVTQQNKFQNLFATALVAMPLPVHHLVQAVVIAVIAAAR